RIGRAAFLAPEILISPFKGMLPLMISFSMITCSHLGLVGPILPACRLSRKARAMCHPGVGFLQYHIPFAVFAGGICRQTLDRQRTPGNGRRRRQQTLRCRRDLLLSIV